MALEQAVIVRHLPQLRSETAEIFDSAPLSLRDALLFHQVPPTTDWRVWILRMGRGAGKTEAAARDCLQHLRDYGARARVGVGAPTQADVRGTCFEGPSGIITLAPTEFRYNRSTIEAWHEKGGYVRGIGSEKAGRWNGPQWSKLWWDELALCRQQSFIDSRLGLRLPPHPQLTITTTPKRTRWVHDLEGRPGAELAHTADGRIPTYHDNPHLSPESMAELEEEYGGTDLGRQEILGEWLDEVQGALWKRAWINDHRVAADDVPDLRRLGGGRRVRHRSRRARGRRPRLRSRRRDAPRES
jgi:phage terminase large subunit-like protein